MSLHQSNPFLSDWDKAEPAAARAGSNIFDADDSQPTADDMARQAGGEQPARRHSTSASHSEAGGNPFGTQRAADRRLYHRNMSSFEAASLQLEQHQQQLQDNGELVECSSQMDVIAKMTAEFQSAIATSDTQFASALADHADQFDPFETIVDDDSLASPAATQTHQEPKRLKSEPELGDGLALLKHESIDDDDNELVSTPVRNIKSPKEPRPAPDCSEPAGGGAVADGQPVGAEQSVTDSMAKASMFASLLASAEPSAQPAAGGASGAELAEQSQVSSMETATHVINGGQADGSPDRQVGFFDPFETVIDRDALSSLMSDSQQQQPPTEGALKPHERANLAGESVSVETVIENPAGGASDTERPANDAREADGPELKPTSRPRPSATGAPAGAPVGVAARSAQQPAAAAKPTRAKKKASFQEDSSDSSEEDDRIRIVIKARDPSKLAAQKDSVIVALSPPPPSRNAMKQARERGQVEDMPSPVMRYKSRLEQRAGQPATDSPPPEPEGGRAPATVRDSVAAREPEPAGEPDTADAFVIPMNKTSDDEAEAYGKADTPLYDEDTSYELEEFPAKCEGPGWEMMLRYPPKKKLTTNRFWKKIFVRLALVPLAPEGKAAAGQEAPARTCVALQIYDKPEDKKPMQEIPIQATYTVSDISSQQFDQFGKIFTIKLQYIFYKERVGVRQGQLARFMHTGHIGSSTTSGGHGVDPLSIGAIKRMGAPIEHSAQISQIIKLGCASYADIKTFKHCLEEHLFRMPIQRERALSTYRTEEVQMAVRDETYIELNQVGTVTRQLARVRLFFLSFLNGTPTVEVGINDHHRQGREVVGRMDILPVVTEEWIRLEACEFHSSVEGAPFEDPSSRIIRLVPPDATFFELMRFRVRPPRNRELPLQVSANMSVTRTRVSINCDVMVPGCVSRKHGQIPCENIAIRVHIPECWIYFFREEKHFRMGSKKSVNRRPGKVKGIERFLGGGGNLQDVNDQSSLIEVTSGQAKYEHHHHAIVWRAARWPKESQAAYVQNSMKIRLPLTAYDKMPDAFSEYLYAEYTMPATTVSHTTLRSISVSPCDEEPAEKYVKYSAKYEYKVRMRLSVNLSSRANEPAPEASPIVIMKQPDLHTDLQREEDSDDDDDDDDDDEGDRGGADSEPANSRQGA